MTTESLQQKIESELLKMKSAGLIPMSAKAFPEVSRRLEALFISEQPDSPADIVEPVKNTPIAPVSDQLLLMVFSKLKDEFGGINTWKIPTERFLQIVENCRKAA